MRASKALAQLADRLLTRRPVVAQAGCIVLRCERGDAEVLVVSTRRRRDRWVLPKGKSAGEELEAARASWQGRFRLVPSVTDSEAAIIVAEGVTPGKRRR